MLTIILIAIKSFIGNVISIFTRYPLQFILVLVCCYAFWQKIRYDAIVSNYAAYKLSVAHQAKMQQLKNDILRKQAKASINDATLIYDNNLKAIKNEYLKKHKLDGVTIGDLRNRLRDQLAASGYTVPETPADTETNTEVWRNSHTAITRQYETLIDACRITTNDFNLLRDWADVACNQVGCE